MKITQNYQAWSIEESKFPHSKTLPDQIEFLLGYGILAPSTHNSQPWLFEIAGSDLIIRPNMRYILPFSDSSHRDLYISLGACATNIVIAANHFSLSAKITVNEEDSYTSSIKISFRSQSVVPEIDNLFHAITARFSDKRILPDTQIPAGKLNAVSAFEMGESIQISSDPDLIKSISTEYLAAAQEFARDPGFVKELRSWMRTNNTRLGDGMPGTVSGLSTGKSVVGKAALKVNPKIMVAMAKKYEDLIATSPAIGVIRTKKDTVESWVDAGRALERLALSATVEGLTLCPMAAMVENKQRSDLEARFLGTGHVQIFFRLAMADQKTGFLHTPRRPASSALMKSGKLKDLVPVGAKSHFIMIGNKRIHYISCGSGEPLLLLHGANIGWGQWYPNLADLSKHNKVVAVDLPGCGESGEIDFHKLNFENDFVGAIQKLIDELDMKGVSIIGHSIGGTVAVKLAKIPSLKIRKIILIDPMGIIDYIPPKQQIASVYPAIRFISRTAMKPNKKNMTEFLLSVLGDDARLDPRFVDYYQASVERSRTNHPLLLISGLVRKFSIKPEVTISEDIKSLKIPYLIIMGARDPLIPIAKVKAELSESIKKNLVVFSGTGHVPSLEKPKEFDDLAIKFLAGGVS